MLVPTEAESLGARIQPRHSTKEAHSHQFPCREEIAQAARKRESPSTGAKDSTLCVTQKDGRPDAMYSGRPFKLTAPAITIYHPVFATFLKRMKEPLATFQFSDEEFDRANKFITESLAFFPDKRT
ncbi:hypothetical protein Hypma_013140 [Hypsizygus marmoreus]|uniref:Uncharacterized protein n=1 Tax=Hypsizygus marmoreus TaxID=39966 RepID=A0A369JG69_HYPMA|nr:hypothetical protein Hypma_013140 [Hypsizygus marmoreus]